LKSKQANLQLTQGIYKINDGTDKQEKTVMYFTAATIFVWTFLIETYFGGNC
jgi:hypothetical protein